MQETLDKKKQEIRYAQRDNSISTTDRIIAWPRMGNIDLALKALVSSLGAKIVVPPPNTNKALEIGVKNSIEGICLPYKLNLANYIMALENGANTLMMFQAPGSCRFGNYTKIGITKDVITRIMTHSSNARIYADTTIKRIAVTNSFMFFRELESYLHNMFNPFRKDTEMFCVPFEHVVCAVEETLRQPFFNFIYSL